MGFLNTKVFIVEKFSFSSKYFFEFLKKKKIVSLSKLDSGNSVLETLASKLDTGFLKSFRIKIQVWYLWPVLYVELLIPKYWRCSCCLYAFISLNFMWKKWIFALQEWSFIKQWCRIIVLRYKKKLCRTASFVIWMCNRKKRLATWRNHHVQLAGEISYFAYTCLVWSSQDCLCITIISAFASHMCFASCPENLCKQFWLNWSISSVLGLLRCCNKVLWR